jgi:hypothetical protein
MNNLLTIVKKEAWLLSVLRLYLANERLRRMKRIVEKKEKGEKQLRKRDSIKGKGDSESKNKNKTMRIVTVTKGLCL